MRIQQCGVVVVALLTGLFVAESATAALTLTAGERVPLFKGNNNVLAAMAINDSPGSSDLTLIIQITMDDVVVLDEFHENIPSDADPTGWTARNFNDSGWDEGEYGIGYGDGDDNTEVGGGNDPSVYSRAEFAVTEIPASFVVGVDYDDGCVIWINGVEVARASGMDTGEFPVWDDWTDQGGGQSHEASKTDPPTYETVTVDQILAVEASGKAVTT